ncbi:MAG: c-type cytochrome, partial [Planctomycetes bacterium]|nr:c-type cytochrome [Planctomycetota bacterium]
MPRQQFDVHENRGVVICRVLAVACVLLGAADVPAQGTVDDDAPQLEPGLLATYRDLHNHQVRRIDERISFDWQDAAPDVRIAAKKFTARWVGRLRTTRGGEYRLSAYVNGKVSVVIGGRLVLGALTDKPTWVDSKPIELQPGHHPLLVDYIKLHEKAQLSLYWSGPGFSLEPLSERWLFHEPKDSPGNDFGRGRLLADTHRCAACHKIPSHAKPMKAPALDRVAGNLSREWIIQRLTESKPAAGEPHQAMPRFALKEDDAEAIAAYLFSNSAGQSAKKKSVKAAAKGDVESGKLLAHTLGCLACHSLDKLGHHGLFGGGDLSRGAQKRPADLFARWLADPAAINRDHRMPRYDLSAVERRDVAAYLATL